MTILKSALAKGILAAAVATATLAATAASADVVCNRFGECWRANDRYTYPAGVGVRFHNDDWAARHHHNYRWRNDRDGRGYYRNGVWIAF